MHLPDPVRRAIRTFAQAFLGVIVLQVGAITADADDGKLDFEFWKKLLLAAVVAGVVAVVTFAWNVLESVTGTDAPIVGK